MTNVHKLSTANNPDHVLEKAIGEYKSVVVVGYSKDGQLDARASLNLNVSDINWIIDTFKQGLIDGVYTDDE